MNEREISEAFRRIEFMLIKSMMDNFKKHRVDDNDWESWQVTQLKELERYRRENSSKFDDDFEEINKSIKKLFRKARRNGYTDANALGEIVSGEFTSSQFGFNDDKLNALIKMTSEDIRKAEKSMSRRAVDDYRKIIFDAQVFAQTGGSYAQAVDMATKELNKRGILNVEYSNGAMHTAKDYASMAIRTGEKRAYFMGLGERMREMGVHTIIVHRRDGACPLCAEWLGKVLVDDVYSGGTKAEAKRKGLKTLSQAMEEGFLHPNCKDIYSVYFDDTPPEEPLTKKEVGEMADQYNLEQQLKRCRDTAESYKNMAENALDENNKKNYRILQEKWEAKAEEIEAQLTERTLGTDNQEEYKTLEMPQPNKGEFIKGKPMTFEQADGNNVNPNYGEGADKVMWRQNCQSCVPAYEARRRGYDVTARPFDSDAQEKVGHNVATAWKDPKTKWYPMPKRCGCTNHEEMVEYITNKVADNTRWQYEFRMSNGGVHTIVIEKENGALILYDPQNGMVVEESDIGNYLEARDVTYVETWEGGRVVDRSPKMFRIDNLEFDQWAMKWLMQQS